jgi:hypothetical protein
MRFLFAGSRYSYWRDDQGVGSSPGRVKNFLFFTASRPALGPTQPPIQWIPVVFLFMPDIYVFRNGACFATTGGVCPRLLGSDSASSLELASRHSVPQHCESPSITNRLSPCRRRASVVTVTGQGKKGIRRNGERDAQRRKRLDEGIGR